MTALYDARGSFVLLRPKITTKLSTQSAEKWICIRIWARETWAINFLSNEKAPYDQIFQGAVLCYQCRLLKKQQEMTTYNSAESTKILVRSIFSSSAYFSPSMTNDGVFEL